MTNRIQKTHVPVVAGIKYFKVTLEILFSKQFLFFENFHFGLFDQNIYREHVENLKDTCEEAEMKYKRILEYCKLKGLHYRQ